MKKNPTWERMRCVFFLQTSNLHPNKQKYKKWKRNTLFLLYKIIIKTKHIKIKIKKIKV
jgi:hypothetical protein